MATEDGGVENSRRDSLAQRIWIEETENANTPNKKGRKGSGEGIHTPDGLSRFLGKNKVKGPPIKMVQNRGPSFQNIQVQSGGASESGTTAVGVQ